MKDRTVEKIRFIKRTPDGSSKRDSLFTNETAAAVTAYQKTVPGYKPTPLVRLSNLAAHYGVGSIFVKDESYRFGLNAFKGSGGSWCIANHIAEKAGKDIRDLSFQDIRCLSLELGDITFVTATDGNHGRGIAWMAHLLDAGAKVFMPKGSSQERLENIRKFGADAEITDLNYDDAVRLADKTARENGWIMIQDTAWPGYEKAPSWIMQGYMTMAKEAFDAFDGVPTHIFLQAGVGAMSGAVSGFAADYYGNEKPVITIVEPDKADCVFRTAQADDGKLHNVRGDMDSIMAGLCCGEPCSIGWEEIAAHCEGFISMPDEIAAKGMRILGNPLGNDPRIISGESGASTMGLVCELLEKPRLAYICEELGLDEDSKILCFSTEGATDREMYRKIVWDGMFPS